MNNNTLVRLSALVAAVCAIPNWAAAQSVASFTVVNADTGVDIATFASSGTVSIANTPNINVRANVIGAASVVFTDGAGGTLTESVAPYAYKGDSAGVYNKWAPAAGAYVINAKPFSGTGGTGTAGLVATLNLTLTGAPPPPIGGTGKLMIDPVSVHHFVYDRDNDGDGNRDPAYLAGVGGPEGFLYENATRKQTIINKLLSSSSLSTSVNGIYFHSMRAFGGDGGAAETPFINNANATSGIDSTKLAAWYTDLKKLDDAGVVLWFTLFDDHSLPYGCTYNSDYANYATMIVNYFKELKHIVWVTQEEYRWRDGAQAACTNATNDARQSNLASAIRAADPIHPIATHHMGGQAMAFPSDTNIRVFGQQTTATSPESMHDSVGKQGWGNWVYVMAEAHPWHMNLIDAERTNGAGREPMRRSNWATALSGGYVMMYNAFECNNTASLCNNNTAPDSDPTDAMLDDLRRLKLFMESTQFNRMTPLFDANGSELTNAKTDGTKYILANQSAGLYILYGDVNTAKLGVRNAPVGTYALRWVDPLSGATVNGTGTVAAGGLASFTKPTGFGPEAALYMRKQ
jgi:hypothetical protein